MTHLAAYMANYANCHHHEVTFTVGLICLVVHHLKVPMTLSQKLVSRYIGSFKVISKINVVAFCLLLPDDWKVHDIFEAS